MAGFGVIAVLAVLPVACGWARVHEGRIRRAGVPLNGGELALAQRLGVARPELVRLLRVARVPPMGAVLRWMGRRLGVVSEGTIGMTLRYGIYIREDHWGERRLVAHELVHVAQYERLGGFCGFLRVYLTECLEEGYPMGRLEREAREIEGEAVRW